MKLQFRMRKVPAYILMALLLFCLLCLNVYGEEGKQKLLDGFDSTEALIELLKKKGVIDDSEAQSFLQQHKKSTQETDQIIRITPRENEEEYIKSVSKGVTEKVTQELNDLKENYEFRSEDLIKKSILLEREIQRLEEMLTEEYKPQLQKSSWAQRVRFGGDIRLRHESVLFDKDNATNIEDPSSPPDLINSTNDEHKQRIRLRVFAKAKIIDPSEVNVGKVEAGARLATGSITNPVSTNHTLGDADDSRTDIVLDRAYVKWQFRPEEEVWGNKIPEISLTGGIMNNPYMSTSLVYDTDLGFEGVALGLKSDTNEMNNWQTFLTLGYYPLEESEWSQKNKYMLGGQIGFKHRPVYGWEYKLAAAYYHYENVEGLPVQSAVRTTADERRLAHMAPKHLQKGNSLFNMDQTGTGGTTYGLMSEFKIFNLNGQIDNSLFYPIRIRLYWDWVRNLGYDPESMAEKISSTEEFIKSVSGDIGYLAGLKVGNFKPRQRWDWNMSIEYRYLESDAAIDAFTDSDFHLGGTNAKGYVLKGELGIFENIWLSAKWMSANEIDDMQKVDTQLDDLAVDTFQFDINAEF